MNRLIEQTKKLKKKIVEISPKKKLIISVVAFLLIACGFVGNQLWQRKFDQRVFDLQQEALTEMAGKIPYQRVTGNYTGEDVEMLRLGNLSADAGNLIQQYGVGIIRIPSIEMELPVLEGITQANISIGAGTVKPNQRIGRGNFALLGHYMTNSGLLFGGLKNVQVGDEVYLTFYDKDAAYIVQEVKIVHQSEGKYMLDNPEEPHYLTLITCDGSRGGTDYRLIVRASLSEE